MDLNDKALSVNRLETSKDKNEAAKSQLLNQELTRASMQPQFLSYFGDIAHSIFGVRYSEFLSELTRKLKLSPKMTLLIALSLVDSCQIAHQSDCK